MRPGELLVQRKIITEKQLARALDAQLIFGAHLGTCLIELGCIDEDSLGRLFSEITGVGYAARERFFEIPPHVIRTLTQSVVERHHGIPFDLKGKTLHVAMVNPRELPGLDEFSFVSGCRIEPWVAPEVRVIQAMERYYDLPRKLRYIVLAGRLDEEEAGDKDASKGGRSLKRAPMAAVAAQYGASRIASTIGSVSPLRQAEGSGASWPEADGAAETRAPCRAASCSR